MLGFMYVSYHCHQAELNDLASHDSPAPVVSPETTINPQQATLAILEQRLTLYREAHQTATNSNETSKLRRLQRGIKVPLHIPTCIHVSRLSFSLI